MGRIRKGPRDKNENLPLKVYIKFVKKANMWVKTKVRGGSAESQEWFDKKPE